MAELLKGRKKCSRRKVHERKITLHKIPLSEHEFVASILLECIHTGSP